MFTYNSVSLHQFGYALPEKIISSEELEEELHPFYERCKLPIGRLEHMTGIKERRFWGEGKAPSYGAVQAGRDAIEKSGIDPSTLEALFYCAVSRDFLEPATASVVHNGLGLSSKTMIFDISNACLGFLNGIITLANMIELGQVKSGIIVSSESAGPLVRQTIKRILNDPEMNRKKFKTSFASLTIGSGAVALILSHKDIADNHISLLGGTTKSASEWVKLCQGDVSPESAGKSSGFDGDEFPDMLTDSETMLHAGCDLAKHTFEDLKKTLNWNNDTADRFICHQVGKAHNALLFDSLGIDPKKDYATYPFLGNTGSVALPISFAKCIEENHFKSGQKAALLGIGSGLNSLMLGVEYS